MTGIPIRGVEGHEFCVIWSRMFPEVWVTDFAWWCCQKAPCGRAFWLYRLKGKARETDCYETLGWAVISGVTGTLLYTSPEQLLGEEVDYRSDIYSTGAVLFELATQRLPFNDSLVPKLTNAILHQAPPALKSLAPKLSTEFERIVLKCLEKDPELRYQSAKELATDLQRLELTSTAVTVAAPVRKRPRRWVVGRRWSVPGSAL